MPSKAPPMLPHSFKILCATAPRCPVLGARVLIWFVPQEREYYRLNINEPRKREQGRLFPTVNAN